MRPSKYARIISYLYPKHFEKLLPPTTLGFLVHLKNHDNSVIYKYTRLDAEVITLLKFQRLHF